MNFAKGHVTSLIDLIGCRTAKRISTANFELHSTASVPHFMQMSIRDLADCQNAPRMVFSENG